MALYYLLYTTLYHPNKFREKWKLEQSDAKKVPNTIITKINPRIAGIKTGKAIRMYR